MHTLWDEQGLDKRGKGGKKQKEREEEKERTLRHWIHQTSERGVHNFKHTYFVENGYSHKWNHRKKV